MDEDGRKLLPSLLPLLVVEGQVLLPGGSMTLRVEELKNMSLLKNYFWNEENWSSKYVGVVPKHPDHHELEHVGSAANVRQLTWRFHPVPHYHVVLVGLCRFKIEKIRKEMPFPVAKITQLDYLPSEPLSTDVKSQFLSIAHQFLHLLRLDEPSIKRILGLLPDHKLADFLTSLVDTTFDEKLEVLEAVDLSKRFPLAMALLQRQVSVLKASQNTSQLKEKGGLDEDKPPKDGIFVIRGGRKKMGRGAVQMSDEDDEVAELEQRLNSAKLPDHALKVAQKELKRLRGLPVQFPEHAVCRNYVETLLELPWSVSTTDHIDLPRAREDMDRDHYALHKVKNRVLEFLAVRKLKNSLKGPILCFVGAPGVGKTSVGRSVAQTLGRKFHRISLGGVSDQADIRGHRRTYIGAMPGRIVQGLKAVGVNNPVFLLDEVDKLYHGLHGDPAAALLEVLDPEQNKAFVDHYLNIPFDLSQVLFIATANSSSKIPSALLDRMEVIEVPGYTTEEKVEIAKRHLLPKQLDLHGLSPSHLQLPSTALALIVNEYTAEAGVRNLERVLGTVCRAAAVKVAGDTEPSLPIVTSPEELEDILGPPKYSHDVCERLTRPGVAVGMAWTSVGGEIMFIEASRMQGTGELILTGQLGDVMKESAQIALNWVRSTSQKYGWSCEGMDVTDLHLHFPAGAVGKDGPSAGSAITVALVSLFSGRCVRSDTAVTGEVTLRGLVLPVGGVKEKVLAAHRAGITHIILPKRNEKDLKDISDSVKRDVSFTLVESVEEVLAHAFGGGIPSLQSKL